MSSFPSYSIHIPKPDIDGIEQLAQFGTPDGPIAVFWIRDTHQVVLEFDDEWYIQSDGYITDSVAEILGVKASVIDVENLCVGNKFDMSTFDFADPEMARQIYNCTWSDYTCDYMILQADLYYPYD